MKIASLKEMGTAIVPVTTAVALTLIKEVNVLRRNVLTVSVNVKLEKYTILQY